MISTSLQILLIIAIAFYFRRIRVFKEGDEKIFNAYIYYVALPSFIFVELNQIPLNSTSLRYALSAIFPILLLLIFYLIIGKVFRLENKYFYILSVSTVFGSTAFFGIPFISFIYNDLESMKLTALIASVSGIIGLSAILLLLEFYSSPKLRIIEILTILAKRFSKNPLIIAIFAGLLTNLIGLRLRGFVYDGLSMFGKSTAVVAIFMLGLYLYGRKYKRILQGILYSIPRMVLLPLITYLVSRLLSISGRELEIIVLLSAMPTALTLVNLTQQYDFEPDLFSNIIMVSTLASTLYLPIIRYLLLKF